MRLIHALLLGGVVGFTSCSKNPTTFTPGHIHPNTTIAEVYDDADIWARKSGDRYWTPISPETESMVPFYDSHSLVLCVRYSGQTLPNGTPAIFNRGDKPRVLHVISAQREDSFYMSGYNNSKSDGWYPKTSVEGFVVGSLNLP